MPAERLLVSFILHYPTERKKGIEKSSAKTVSNESEAGGSKKAAWGGRASKGDHKTTQTSTCRDGQGRKREKGFAKGGGPSSTT